MNYRYLINHEVLSNNIHLANQLSYHQPLGKEVPCLNSLVLSNRRGPRTSTSSSAFGVSAGAISAWMSSDSAELVVSLGQPRSRPPTQLHTRKTNETCNLSFYSKGIDMAHDSSKTKHGLSDSPAAPPGSRALGDRTKCIQQTLVTGAG